MTQDSAGIVERLEADKARELFEIARPCFHYAPRGTPDGGSFERSETGRLLMNAMGKIAAHIEAQAVEIAELKAQKWAVKHTDTANALVEQGMALEAQAVELGRLRARDTGWSMQCAEQQEELEKMREALQKCRDQFAFYADEHKAKSDAAHKAWDDARYWGNVDEQNAAHKEYHKRLTQTQTNEAMVAQIDAALGAKP